MYKDMLGRVSNWPVPTGKMFTNAAAEYAIKRLNGEMAKNGISAANAVVILLPAAIALFIRIIS